MNNTQLISKNKRYMFDNAKDLIFIGSYNTPSVYKSINKILSLDDDGTLKMADNSNPFLSSDKGAPLLRRLTLDDDGNLRVYSLDSKKGTWTIVWQAIQEFCTIHGTCGPNYICMGSEQNKPYCVCPPGFQTFRKSSGEFCERKNPFTSSPQDSKFLRLDYVNFSGGPNETDLRAPNFTTCESKCLANPNCLGFEYKYTGEQYCVHHLDRLLYGYWSPASEVAMFLRVAKAETDKSNFTGMTTMIDTICSANLTLPRPHDESNTTPKNLAILITLFTIELTSGAIFFWAFVKKYIKYRDMAHTLGLELLPLGGPKRFTYAELKAATRLLQRHWAWWLRHCL
uniref:Apple domain-containing protein n=1 Tax=Nelumbo nucifera TaxID=4432 RepID=A0A822YJK9_NELNU|nr:TPA_asm: hypothetical protein HUJ06_011144 [Nelumbo nucifera]